MASETAAGAAASSAIAVARAEDESLPAAGASASSAVPGTGADGVSHPAAETAAAIQVPPAHALETWYWQGPHERFKFTPKVGENSSSWEATCYRHGGRLACRKTRVFHNAQEEARAVQYLKKWCLDGRRIDTRDLHVHQWRAPCADEMPSAEVLEAQLREAP